MSELATTHGSALVLQSDADYWNERQLAALRQMGLEQATEGDLAVFHHVAQRTGLDPFAKQLYMIGRWSRDGMKYTIQTGIDGFRLVARRASDRLGETLEYEDTVWCGNDGVWRDVWLSKEPPAACRVVVLRHGKRFPGVASLAEFGQTTKNGDLVQMWRNMPANMLAKCAEAQALRRAFPQELAAVYADDEMGQADREPRAESPAPSGPSTGRQRAAERAAAAAGAETGEALDVASDLGRQMLTLLHQVADGDLLGFVSETLGRDVSTPQDMTLEDARRVVARCEQQLADAEVVEGVVEPDPVDPAAPVVEDPPHDPTATADPNDPDDPWAGK